MKIKKIIKKSRKLVDVTLSGLLQLFGLKKLNIFPDVYAYLYGSKNTRCILKTKKFIVLKSNDYLKITAAIDKGNEALSIEKNQFDKTNKSFWELDGDNSIRNSAQDFRREVLSPKLQEFVNDKKKSLASIIKGRGYWRIETMRRINQSRPELFSGRVLEVGAGTGTVSSMLSKFENIDSIECSDYDEYSVDYVMPVYQWALNANIDKITRTLGSYNNINTPDNQYDAIVAVGALHHSEDLLQTMKECFRVLKPGGSFVISDYALTNTLTQDEYNTLMNVPRDEVNAQKFEDTGLLNNINTNRDISEHGRPICLYQSAAFQAGFDVETFIFDANAEANDYLARFIRKIKTKTGIYAKNMKSIRELGYDYFGNVKSFSMKNIVHYPFYALNAPSLFNLMLRGDKAGKPVYDNMVLILQKPENKEYKIAYRYVSGNMYNFPTKVNSM